jgi:predicted ATPase with chaperone activity
MIDEELQDEDPWAHVPPVPTTIEETGIPEAFLRELALKTIWAHDMPTLGIVSGVTGLHARVVEELVAGLARENLAEVDSASAAGTMRFRYRLTDRGKTAAHEALSRSRYVGVAPVPVGVYNDIIAEQVRGFRRPPLEDIKRALSHMVLPERLIEVIGQAFFSRRALMIYGPSGNGKTDMVTSIARMVAGTVIIPFALYGHGQLIRVYDPDVHKSRVDETPGEGAGESLLVDDASKHDRRWLPVHRPNVIVGGDMGAEALEMSYDATQGVHQAPLSVVAQGGVLVIDDLGRQKVSPKEILNRWVLMMEQGYDSFALSSSEIVRLPLDVTLVFSTNLTLNDLMDEAYLRRIAYKIAIPDPTRDQLAEIARRFCASKDIAWTEDAIDYLMDRLYAPGLRPPHGCFARDIVTTVMDEAEFHGREPVLDRESIDTACALYLGEDGLPKVA